MAARHLSVSRRILPFVLVFFATQTLISDTVQRRPVKSNIYGWISIFQEKDVKDFIDLITVDLTV